MHAFDVEQLKSFIAAVDARSITAAAPARSLSQSALSEQLAKLEARAGQTLLLRAKSGVTPTAAGVQLLRHARRIVGLSEAAWRDMHEIPEDIEVGIGVTGYFRSADLGQLLARAVTDCPRIRLRSLVGMTSDIQSAYERGEIDLALLMSLTGAKSRRSNDSTELGVEPLQWVTAAGRPDLPRGRPVPLVLLPEFCSLHRLAVDSLQKKGMPFYVSHIASGVEGLTAALEAGLGVGCLNASAAARPGLRTLSKPALPSLPKARFFLRSRREERFDEKSELQELAAVVTKHFTERA
ncbi:LysR family transcriptional regulator [Caballeronia sp. LZ034LL]|uniref:LysR family transcriptional regulator n=1 Tax=Caballeronia sp. LZ034LL TaxID=3038567 RepID=UPI00285CAA73|nr:LysR family transcriptional regulator [Caballeronia sp. LZ034LL]MDR5835896.1 LysR family transcriptional regulator [Caballeronia sp. LZ034LL]